jgi:monofunctional biosynthetic peptidoglycan transglycosylase
MNSNNINDEKPGEPVIRVKSHWKKKLALAIIVLITTIIFFSVWIYFSLPETIELKTVNPSTTSLIEYRRLKAKEDGKQFKVKHKWVRFKDIPDILKKAIRISEDSNFYSHDGIDYDELKESIKKNWEKGEFARGGSTITQQLAKNLYLSTEKSIIRKIREYCIAHRLENTLSKNRIYHLYLNLIEFGPGIFGVEAAARHYFNKSVSALDLKEIIRLTAIIPRPLSIAANGNSRWLLWRCRWILDKLLLYKYIDQVTYNLIKPSFS